MASGHDEDTREITMSALLAIAGFAAVLAAVNWRLRRREAAGDFDPQSPSSAARPGVRRFFDYRDEGWRASGVDQRPPEPDQYG